MTPTEFQQWLGAHGHPVTVDGKLGPQTRAALLACFTNACAPAVTEAEIEAIAARLGCGLKQIRAVSMVESGGAAFDRQGRPKILFERHLFHRLTNGEFSVSSFSNPKAGGYADDSWQKLALAACKNPKAAFSAASWGKFQVMGLHWAALEYPSALDMAYSAVTGEAAHYEMLARYIERNGLRPALAKLSTDPLSCRDFARGYNGPDYSRNDYDVKLARAMR
jgi:hypothetical protein